MSDCTATREAVEELQDEGHIACPLCGQDAYAHQSEAVVFRVECVSHRSPMSLGTSQCEWARAERAKAFRVAAMCYPVVGQ